MNRLVVALFVACSGAFTALFLLDLQGYFTEIREPVAYLEQRVGTVRRLPDRSLTWDRAVEGTRFAMGDAIATGEGASARLVFYGGGELDLETGAMVVLEGDPEELKLDFVSGGGRVRVARQASKKFTVTRGQTEARAARALRPGAAPPAPASARVQVEQVADLKVVEAPAAGVAAGPAGPGSAPAAQAPPAPEEAGRILPTLTAAVQEEKIRNLGEALDTGGKLVSDLKLPPPPEIVGPAPDAIVDLGEGAVPTLAWKLPEGAAGEAGVTYEVILRPADGEGRPKLLRAKTSSVPLSSVPRGKYLWSVRTVTEAGVRSPATTSRWLEVKIPANIAKPRILPVKVQ